MIIKFRESTPKRTPADPSITNYSHHRSQLISDYGGRCGYCDDINKWRFAWFEIDHFVPQFVMKNIKPYDYSNLVYACRSCNNAKRKKWPTKDETVHNQNDEGFIDPCDSNYDLQFERTDLGRIVPKTNLGKWKYNALKLYKPQHEVIWNLEQLHHLKKEIRDLLEKNPDNAQLKDRLLATHEKFDNYLDALFI